MEKITIFTYMALIYLKRLDFVRLWKTTGITITPNRKSTSSKKEDKKRVTLHKSKCGNRLVMISEICVSRPRKMLVKKVGILKPSYEQIPIVEHERCDIQPNPVFLYTENDFTKYHHRRWQKKWTMAAVVFIVFDLKIAEFSEALSFFFF